MTNIIFLGAAEDEVLAAARYYETHAPGLGRDFLGEVQSTVDHIAEYPRSGTVLGSDIRRRLVRRFPFEFCIASIRKRSSSLALCISGGAQIIGTVEDDRIVARSAHNAGK